MQSLLFYTGSSDETCLLVSTVSSLFENFFCTARKKSNIIYHCMFSHICCNFLILRECLIRDSTIFHQITKIKNWECWIFTKFHVVYIRQKKWKRNFQIREMCFSKFYMDIIFPRLIRNSQYTLEKPSCSFQCIKCFQQCSNLYPSLQCFLQRGLVVVSYCLTL